MITCPWCGTRNAAEASVCIQCGAPFSAFGQGVQGVAVDLTGVKDRVTLTIKRLPQILPSLIPGTFFETQFVDTFASLTPKAAKQTATASGGGAIAQGRNATAVGAGGVYIGGNAEGNIIMNGNNNSVNSNTRRSTPITPVEPEVLRLALWLPTGVTHVIVSGNGKTIVYNQCFGIELDCTDSEVVG